jgi:ATPase subunit of ABC transporter with duplicated ATPase domains
MNLVAGDLEPTAGEARRSIKLRVGRYAQHFVDALEMDDTPVEYLMRTWGHMRKEDDTELKEYDVRAMLGKFGLAGHHHHQVRCPAFTLGSTYVYVGCKAELQEVGTNTKFMSM